MPWTMEAIAITVATPITTPRIVSAERSLLARSCSTAMSQPSDTEWSFTGPVSFVSQRHYRIEPRRPHGGIHAEDHTHTGAEAERHHHGPEGDPRREGRDQAHDPRERHTARKPQHPAQRRERHRLGEELVADVPRPGAERLTDADLAGALVHA